MQFLKIISDEKASYNPEHKYSCYDECYPAIMTVELSYRTFAIGKKKLLLLHRLYDYLHNNVLSRYMIAYIMNELEMYAMINDYACIYADRPQYTINNLNEYGFNYDPHTGLYCREVLRS